MRVLDLSISLLLLKHLTDNKNRSASSIRTILQKNGGRLGESGSTKHLFNNCGIIQIEKNQINEEKFLKFLLMLEPKTAY